MSKPCRPFAAHGLAACYLMGSGKRLGAESSLEPTTRRWVPTICQNISLVRAANQVTASKSRDRRPSQHKRWTYGRRAFVGSSSRCYFGCSSLGNAVRSVYQQVCGETYSWRGTCMLASSCSRVHVLGHQPAWNPQQSLVEPHHPCFHISTICLYER